MKLVMVAILFSSSLALGLTKTAQNLSPDDGQSEVRGGANYATGSLGASGVTADISGYQVLTSYMYGLTSEHALGVAIGYSSTETRYSFAMAPNFTTKTRGVSDVLVAYQGNYDLGGATFFTQLGALIPTEKSKTNRDTNENNVSSGRVSPVAEIGIVNQSSSAAFGAHVRFKLPQEGDVEKVSGGISETGKVSGGNELRIGVFAELLNNAHTNFELSYKTMEKTTEKYSSSSTNYLEQKFLQFDVSFRFQVAPGFEILPTLNYQTLMNKSDLNINTYNVFMVGILGRFLF